ncbi:MAG TPA: phage tail tape measure protein [Desulfotomaculum sp.]|nr:MAG: hypothetical protein JL56_03020 [Desulfotomaculum sp. BICA1-6]HBX22676.1 phage tail tape measure protein [Desulfotomaculum sp.]
MSSSVIEAQIRAFDQFSREMQRYRRELERIRRQQDDTRDDTDRMNRSFANFFQTLGGLGALYAFQQALQAVSTTGREFELSIRQAQAVTGDFTTALRDFTMETNAGIHGPLQMAEAFYELGSAGLNANETIASTPDILEFATAGLIGLEQSAYSVIATVQAFRLEWEQTGEVVDAFTEAMNSTTLAAGDFQWIMSSAGAVAKMAGQDFREVLAAGAAMKDAGVQAQDAGTSIKAALLQMINPTDEAKGIMAELGVEIYNASGQMKQWHEIVAEFEKALVPYNQESQNLILATVLGSDGIRAMATSLNMGSAELASYVDAMSDAEGATGKMSDMMADTFDGALKQTNANFERMKILIFEDLEPAMVSLMGTINSLIVEFNNLDESTRKTIEFIAGSAGMVVAFGTLYSMLRMLAPLLGALGISTAGLGLPIGIAVAAVGALTAGLIAGKGASESSRLENERHNESMVGLGKRYDELTSQIAELEEGTAEHTRTKEELTAVMNEIARLSPSVVSAWGAEGDAIAINNGLLRENIALAKQARNIVTVSDMTAARNRMSEIEDEVARQQRIIKAAGQNDYLQKSGNRDDFYRDRLSQIDKLNAEYAQLSAQVDKAAAQLAEGWEDDNWAKTWAVNSFKGKQKGAGDGGGKSYTPPGDKDDDKGKTPEDIAREEFEASRRFIEYRKALNQMALDEELAAWERVQSRYKQGSEERMQADQEVYRVKQEIAQRDEQLHQEAYNQAMDLMRHEVNMARMSTDERIRYLEKLRDAHEWNMRQVWDIEEELYRLRRQQLDSFLDDLDSEYQDKLDDIDERTKASIKAIQDQIDALDEEGEESGREEAARQHNERLKELQDKRKYHELRTGTEHQKAIADIDKEIAEEKRQFELKQQEWSREDQKADLEEKLDQVREEGQQERDELEEHYRRARDIATSGIMDVIAALAATEPDWMDTGKKLVDALIAGMESGDFSRVEDIIDQVRDGEERQDNESGGGGTGGDGSKEPIGTLSKSQYTNINGTAAMWSRTLANILDSNVSFDPSTGKVTIGGKTFAPLKNEDGKTYVGIRTVAEALGHDVDFDATTKAIRIYHQGGPIEETGLAYVERGEYMLPANLVDAIRMGAMPPSGGFGAMHGGGQTIIHITAPLLAPENLYLSDEMDMARVNSELRRGIMSLATAKG